MTAKRSGDFVRIYDTTDLGQVALIKVQLDGAGIAYYVENELSPLPGLGGGLALLLFVQGSRADEARQLIQEVAGHPPG